MEPSERVRRIPPYLFAQINRKIAEAKANGVDVISLAIGDPDMPTPQPVIDALERAVADPGNHQYPDYEGMPAFRQAVAAWYLRRHNVVLHPDREVLALIGGKEGSLHVGLAFINPGDYALVPSPSYPPYTTGTLFAGGLVHEMPLLAKNDFLPKLADVPEEIARRAKVMFLNYPNVPTGAVATEAFYREVVAFAKKHDIIVVSDNPYSEIGLDGYRPLSFLEVEGAMEVGIELNSLSKPYNMTGWRIGMAVGNAQLIDAMKITKNNVDSGVFSAVQHAGIAAMALDDRWLDALNAVYQKRRDRTAASLEAIGLPVQKPKATFYLWVRVPEGETSMSFAEKMLEKAGVVVTPGSGYGRHGEGYIRISLTIADARLDEALRRIREALQ